MSATHAGTPATWFARVEPLLGEGLIGSTLSIENLPVVSWVVELLVSCRLGRVRIPAAERDRPALRRLRARLAWKNPRAVPTWTTVGTSPVHVAGRWLPPGGSPRVQWDADRRRVVMHVPAGDSGAFADVSVLVARRVCDILLGRSGWPDRDVYVGSRLWPYSQTPEPLDPPEPPPVLDPDRHVLVVGTGSVGSEALRQLAGCVERWSLADPARVSIYNPVRQWFGLGEVGRSKVEVLAGRLGGRTRRWPGPVDHRTLDRFESWIDEDPPDLVLLATGRQDDALLAGALHRRGIPHIVAYAYPQARFFEVSVIEPGTPCLHCYRGHLFRGPEAADPAPDDLAAFLYRLPSATERERLYRDLVAEPATALETGRIGAVVARCARELLAPPSRRNRWFQRLFEEGTTCLLGGNVVEEREPGIPAYGLTFPGQVVRLGLPDLAGVEDRYRCEVCDRELRIRHRERLPGLDPDDADRWVPA